MYSIHYYIFIMQLWGGCPILDPGKSDSYLKRLTNAQTVVIMREINDISRRITELYLQSNIQCSSVVLLDILATNGRTCNNFYYYAVKMIRECRPRKLF